MNNKKIIKSILLLIIFFTFFVVLKSPDSTYSIYKEELTTTINLTINSANGYTVTFDSQGGTSVQSRTIQPNQPVGTLPIPTKANSNFAGWYDSNNQRVRHSTLITANTQLHAVWTDVVCRRVTDENDLHKETCASSGGCAQKANFSVNSIITYGTIGDGDPEAGDAYDCDVDYDGTFDAKESDNKTFTERFYFIREKTNSGSENSAVMYYSTSFDVNGRNNRSTSTSDIGSYKYTVAQNYLPTSSLWDNPLIVDLDGNGQVSRFITIEDIESVCGTLAVKNTSYFNTCQKFFWFENTRFHSDSRGRSGIWIEQDNSTIYRIQVHTFYVETPDKGADSENTVRPVIEIPMSALEGYYDEDRFTISFSTYNNDPNPLSGIEKYRGETIGNLPTPTRQYYAFTNWYTDSNLENVVDPTTLVEGNMTLFAGWEALVSTVEVTLNLNGGTISGVTSPISIEFGGNLNDLPDPTQQDMTFLGWYTDSGFNTPFDKTQSIMTDITIYAKWELTNPEARIGSTLYATLAQAIDAVPNGNVMTTITVLKDITLTEAAIIPSGKWVELNLQNYTLDTNSDNLIENSGKLDIINGHLVSTYHHADDTNKPGYVIYNKSGATLNVYGGTITYDNTSGTEAKPIQNVSGTVNITGGRIENNSTGAVINNKNSNGVLNVSGGVIIGTATSKGQGIYMDGGAKTNISGNAYIENVSTGSGGNARAAVDNNKGTLNITGGTIVSKNYYAVANRNGSSTTNIGINDSGGNIIDTTTPVLKGKKALYRTAGTINVYDGVFESVESAANDGTVENPAGTTFTLNGTEIVDTTTYNIYYLTYTSGGPYTVTFDPDNGDQTTQVTNITAGNSVGSSNMPTPTKTNYIFEKWFIYKEVNSEVYDAGEFTSTTPVVDNITVKAKWKPGIGTAIILPVSISIDVHETETITVIEQDGMESYTFSSNNTNVATVDANGVVTGVASGSTTITITGAESGDTKTINVSVAGNTPATCTVTFDKGDGSATTSVSVTCGDTITAQQMPQDPTKSGYVFTGWVKENTSTKITTSYPINESMNAIATWNETVQTATVTPNPISLTVGAQQQILLTAVEQGETVELATFTSNATSIATVNANGVVTAVGAGSTTITITGIDSNLSRNINITVSVAPTQYNVSFETNGGTTINPIPVNAGGTLGNNMPQDPTKTDHTFAGWFNQAMTVEYDENTVINEAITFYAKWIPNSAVCEMDGTYYDTVQAAVNAVPNNTLKTINLIKDVSSNITGNEAKVIQVSGTSKKIIFDLQGHTINYVGAGKVYVIYSNGEIEIRNGTITTNAMGSAAINVMSGGKLTMNSGTITATGNRQAIYNYGGTVIIGGTTNLTAATDGDFEGVIRATVANVSGTTTITGGTIVNSLGPAVSINKGTLTIGENDGTIDTTTPVIQGNTYGLHTASGTEVTINVYDGIFKGTTDGISNTGDTTYPSTTDYDTDDTEVIGGQTYKLAYLYTLPPAPSSYTITLNANGGTCSESSISVDAGDAVDNLPVPTRGAYVFDGWYTAASNGTLVVEGVTIPTQDTTYYAMWSYTSSSTPVSYTITSDAMTAYFTNIASWVSADATDTSNKDDNTNNDHLSFLNSMNANFTTYNCSSCADANKCSNPTAGTYCEQPKGYNTNIPEDLNVYTYVNNTKGTLVTYTTSTNGVIYNMIPGQTYYWESTLDSSVYGVVTAVGNRRTIYSPVRNLRDLGGMSVDTDGDGTADGTVKYGMLYRGAQNTSGQSGVDSLTKLGIDREIDLRETGSENSGQSHLPTYDVDGDDTRFNGTSRSDSTTNSYKDIVIRNYLINPTTTDYFDQAYINNYREFKQALKMVMRYVVEGDSIYFHCTIGTDRTGTMAYFLEGLLGVPLEERIQDYELTYYFGLLNRHRFHNRSDKTLGNQTGWTFTSNFNPRFEAMYKSYSTYQEIYDFYTYERESDDDTLLADFKSAMIDSN